MSEQIQNYIIAGLACYGVIKFGAYILRDRSEETTNTQPKAKRINKEVAERRIKRARELKEKADLRLKAIEDKYVN